MSFLQDAPGFAELRRSPYEEGELAEPLSDPPRGAGTHARRAKTYTLSYTYTQCIIFQKMKEEGKGSKAPLTESFIHYPNNKYVLLALLGATAGMGVVWYTGQFYALFFLTITLKLGYLPAYLLILTSLIIGTPYHTLADAFSGWRDSPPHRANMLNRSVTRMGIAAAYAPTSKYKVFWALILVGPDSRRG
jgi:hypothetical protein